MRIALASDVHLEFGHLELTNTENADVLVLSGDICVASKFGPDYDRFFNDCSREFKNVIYIMGNHEHYNGDYAKSADILRNALARYENIHFLDKECVTIDDVTFIGGTLWTDMNKEDPITLQRMSGMMNDFRCVSNSNNVVTYKAPVYKTDANGDYIMTKTGDINHYVQDGFEFKTRVARFSPSDAVVDHKEMVGYIRSVIEGKFDQKFVVCGHHAPTKLSTHPRYKDEFIMNGGYSSDLSEFIMDHPQIKLWTHGHTHEEFDYMMGSTRVLCNPRGYIHYEHQADVWKLKSAVV